MRKSARWMVLLDDRILEYVSENGPTLPSDIANDDRIPYGAQHIGNRCRKLTEHGFLDNLGNGVYVITQRGRDYLNEEFDAEQVDAEGDSGGESASADGNV
ncbi:MarR family transcriptional regulator [Halorarum halobium]|uniref:MarR family transcriptional regulator n=1 Tax=Halorarum halobium TaxID=3075121 RepID=UPI0028A5D9B0|nr:MarR family transcriptional regulator [Halobaculum sp. XH14]